MSSKHEASGSNAGRLYFDGTTVVVLNAQNDLGDTLVKFLLSQGANVVAQVIETQQVPCPPQGRLVAKFTTSATESSLIEAALSEFGTINILVNLVNVALASLIADSVVEKWHCAVLGTLKAAYKVCLMELVWLCIL